MISSIELSELRNRALDHRQHLRYLDERTADARARVSVSVRHALRPAQIFRQLRRLGYACTPQLVRSVVWHEYAPLTKTYPTSWLNGLRGIAAVKVVTFHYVMAYSDFGFQPWGVDERHTHFFELPVIRYFYAGFSSQLFFGISGFLIATRVFQAQEKRHTDPNRDLFTTVSIDLFRKVFRLYLPVFAITSFTMLYIYFGFYESYRTLLLDHEKLFPGDWYEPKPKQMALFKQIGYWIHEMFDLSNIITENTLYPFHDQHLWAILAEMRGTLHLYGLLIAISQCRPRSRLVAMLVAGVLYFCWNHWEIWAFILGAVVAQLDWILSESSQRQQYPVHGDDDADSDDFEPAPTGHPSQSSVQQHWSTYNLSTTQDHQVRRGLRFAGLIVAFYFLSYPVDGARYYAPGYLWLNKLIPRFMVRKDKFYPNIGTAMLLLILARSDPNISNGRKMLMSDLSQYLGKISFALFLVHGPVMHSIGYMLPHKLAWTFGAELLSLSDFSWLLSVGFGWSITLLLCLWAADVWHREVEARCIDLTRKLERICFA